MQNPCFGLFRVFCLASIFCLTSYICAQPLAEGAGSERTLQAVIDSDHNPGTGCTFTLENGGSVQGVEVVLTLIVQVGAMPQVTVASYQACENNALGSPIDLGPGPWPVGSDNGTVGSDVVEAAMPLLPLGVTKASRMVFQAFSGNGTYDVLALTAGGSPIVYGFPVEIPTLSTWMLLVLTALIGLMGLRFIRRRRFGKHQSLLLVLGVFGLFLVGAGATIVIDGQVGDWAGQGPLATDPVGDAFGDDAVDINAVYVCNDASSLFLRFDLTNLENTPPTADPVTATLNEDGSVTVTLSGSDPEGDPLTFSIATSPANGGLGAINPLTPTTAEVVYTPTANFFGSDSFTYRANDGTVDSAPATVGLTVDPVNDPPEFTAGPDINIGKDLGPQTIPGWATNIGPGPMETGQNVSFGASNDNNPLFSVQPALSPTGTLTFTTAANANGTAMVTLTAMDDGGTANGGNDTSAPQSFSITVTAVNDPPSFIAGPDQSLFEDDGPVSVPGWATAISPGPPDEAGQTVSFIVNPDNPGLFSTGPSVDGTGTLSFTAAPDANGATMVTVQAMDDGGTANGGNDTSPAQTFTITVMAVNDAPSFVAGPDQILIKDLGPQSIPGWASNILAGPPDEAGQGLSFLVSNDNNGLFTVQPAVSPDGTLTFTTAANVNGSVTVSLSLMDDGGTANGGADTSPMQMFSIQVDPVNDAPSFTAGADESVFEDSGIQTVPGWATAISPGPPDEAGQTVSFLVNNDNLALFSAQPAVDASGTLTYTPAADANGMASVTVTAMDDGGTANGGVDSSAAQMFAITVGAVNDPPSFALGPDPSVDEDSGAASFPAFVSSISPGPADEAGQSVSFGVMNDNNALFSVQPAIDASGNLTFTPAAETTGMASVTVTAMDDGGTANGGVDTSAAQMFTITVNGVNDAPSFTAGADESVFEDSGMQTVPGWATAISPGPPDEAGQTVSFLVNNDNLALFSAQPAVDASGTLTYTPAADANGMASVTVTAMDDGGTANGGVDSSAAQMFAITVGAVNDPPSFALGPDPSVNEDSGAASFPAFASSISPGPPDEAGQVVSFSAMNDNNALFSVQPAIDASGNLTFTPAAETAGMASVTVTAMDDGGTANGGVDTSAPQMFTITVNGVNDAPSFTAGADESVFEDSGMQTVPGWATAISPGPPDEAGQTVSFLVNNDNLALFSAQPAVDASGTLTYTPAADANGMASVTVTAMDDGGTANGGVDSSAAQMFTITVGAVNDPPSFALGPDPSVNEDSGAASFPAFASSISPGPPDEAGQVVSFSAMNDNNALFSVQPAIDASGNLTFTPTANTSGMASVTVTAMDDGGTANGGVDTSAAQMFTITVNGVNDAPSFVAGANESVLEDSGMQTVPGWATAISPGPPDEAGQVVSFLVNNDNMALFSVQPAVNTAGTLTYTPANNANGMANVTVTAMDDGGTANGGVDTSASQMFTIAVTPVNDPPTAVPFQASYDAHTHIGISVPAAEGLLVSSTDVEIGTTLSMDTTPINVTAGAVVTLAADGGFTVNPPPDFTGAMSFDYRIGDDGFPGPGVFSAYTTVTVDVAGPAIWFADDGASPGGNGTLALPFQTLADANTAADMATHRIFLFSGDYTGDITLTDGVGLIGQGVTGTNFDDLFGITPPANSIARPAINGVRPIITSGANGVTVGMNNAVRGVQIDDTTGIGIAGTGFGTLTVTDCAITGAGQALGLTNGTLAAANGFGLLTSNNSAGPGISLSNVAGSLSNTDNTSQISAPTGTAFSVSGSNPTITWQGSITKNNAGRVVNIASLSGGSVSLPGNIGANHSGSTGILVDGNTGGAQIGFGGASIALNTGANAAVSVTNNGASGGATVNFTGGALDIDTTSGAGFTASGGGTVNVNGAANTVDSTTGTALTVTGTNIGTGMTFRSISANGAVSGIVLNGTGATAGLTVTGTGAANSGGTIQNTTNAGIQLTNTLSPSFTSVRILNTARSGIKGTMVNHFTFTSGTIDNSGTALGVDDSNIAFNTTAAGTETNLTGTVTITNNTLTNAYFHGVDVFNFNGTLDFIDISGNTITSTTSTVTSKGGGIRLIAFGSAATVANVTRASITNNVIRNFPSGVALQTQGGNANAAGPAGIFGVAGHGTNIIGITGNRISGASAANRIGAEAIITLVNGKGQGNFNISNNGTMADPIANMTGTAIGHSAFGLAVVTTTISNNVISANNSFAAQGIGAGVDQVPGIGDTPDLTLTISNNTISNTDGNGILAVARNSNGTMRARIQNNTVAAPLGGVRPGIRVDSGTAVGNTTVCLNISGNTSAGSGGSQGLGLRKQGTAPAVNTFGVNGMAATSTPGVEAYVNGLNPAGGGTLLISATSGFTNCSLP